MAGEAPAVRDARRVSCPSRQGRGVGLTPALQDAVVRAADEIVVELLARGFDVHRRATNAVSVPLPWWETPVIVPVPAPELALV